MEAGNLRCMLECKCLDFVVCQHVVGVVALSDRGCLGVVDGTRGFHIPDNLLPRDLRAVVVLVNSKDQGRGMHAVQMFDKLLVHEAGHVVHLGHNEEFVEANEECFDCLASVRHRLEDCLAGLFLKAQVAEVLVCGFEEVFHRVGATEDCPLVDGEVVASPRVGSSFVEERERRVDFARGVDVVDVLDEVAMEGLVALLVSVVPIRRVDLVADTCIDLYNRLLSSRLLCRGLAGGRGWGWYWVGRSVGWDACDIS